MTICCLGDLVLDVIVRLEQPLAPDGDATSRIVLRPGGQAANVAAWSAIAPLHAAGKDPATGPVLLLTRDAAGGRTLLLALNPGGAPARFPLPRAPGGASWQLALDTGVAGAALSPPPVLRPRFAAETSELEVQPRSLRILLA